MSHEPDLLVPGVTWQVTQQLNNTGTRPITSGTTVSRTYFGGVEINSNRVNLCDNIQGGCPIRVGPAVSISPRTQLSRFAPKGTYTTISKGVDNDGKELSCVEWKFTIQ